MKVKCPECPVQVSTGWEFYHHIKEKHEYYAIDILWKLVAKIAERREYWKKNEDSPEHYGFEILDEHEYLLGIVELAFNKDEEN